MRDGLVDGLNLRGHKMTDYTIGGEILKNRKLVTLDGSKVTTETGIPLARNIVLPGVQSDGSDVRLALLDGTPIAREIECVGVPSTDAVMFHYPFDTVAGENSQFYVYWGNASLNEPAANSTYGSEAVWDSNFKYVNHANIEPYGGSAGEILDSTWNSNDGTASDFTVNPSLLDGDYGKGINVDGIKAYIATYDMDDTTDFTTTLKLKRTASQTAVHSLFGDIDTGVWSNGWGLLHDGADSNGLYGVYTGAGYSANKITLSNDVDYTVDVVRSGGNFIVYVNGVHQFTEARTLNSHSFNLYFGQTDYVSYAAQSKNYYEMRHSNTARSANYIATAHKNLNNPTASGTDPFYLNRYDDSQTYRAKSNSSGAESTFLRRTPIVRNHTGVLTEYQQRFTIPSHELMNPDYSCIRFNTQADGNGEHVPYWIESKTDGVTADIWVKSDYASGDDIIYMFYGNSSLTSESSIRDVWVIGDDFEDNDISDWNTGDFESLVGTKCLVSNGEVGGSGTSEAWMKKSIGETLTDYTLLWKTKAGYPDWTSIQIGIDSTDTYYSHGHQGLQDDFEIGFTERAALGASNPVQYLDWGISSSTYYTYMVRHTVDGSFTVFINDVDVTSLLDVNSADSTVQTITDIAVGCRRSTDVVDFVALGKSTTTEPTYTIGVTEAPERFSAVSDISGNVSIFRKAKPIHIKHEGALTDQQVTTTIVHEADMLYNFDDIRFVTLSGEHVPYWIESKTDGVTAKVWFMGDFGDGDTYVWMYYGNEGLSAGSSGVDTFNLFDFIGYTEVDPSSHITITNSKIDAVDVTTDAAYVHKTIPSITDFIHEFEYYRASGASPYGAQAPIIIGDGYGTLSGFVWGTKNGIGIYADSNPHSFQVSKWVVGAKTSGTSIGYSENTLYYVTLQRVGTTLTLSVYSDADKTSHISGSPQQLAVVSTAFDTLNFATIDINYNYQRSFYVQDFLAHKNTAVEPIVTVGAEQHPRTGNIIMG